MMNNNYAKAYTEVLEIISHFSESDYNKIPASEIEFYEANKDKDYDFKLDLSKDLSEQNISKEANAIIISIYRDFYATDEQKQKIQNILNLKDQLDDNEKRNKYSPDDIFKSNKIEELKSSESTIDSLPVEIKKENFFIRFINYIKSIFKF